MKILNYKPNSPSFKHNKIYVYSDFDRTLSPNTTQGVFSDEKTPRIKKAKYNFDLINKLIKKYEDLSFIITTGRTNTELKRMQELYNNHGIGFVNAESIITKEGSDEFIKSANLQNSYSYTQSNLTRNQKIKNITKWDKEKILNQIEKIIKKEKLSTLFCDTTLSAERYGQYSVFSQLDKITSKTVLIRNVDSIKIFLGFVPEVSDEKYIDIKNQISHYLKKNKIEFEFAEKKQDHECRLYRTLMISPKINGESLTKCYDIKERIKTMDNTDFVIVAGDGANDYEMLNPENYLKVKNNKLEDLPFLGIVVQKENEPEPSLEFLVQKYGPNSKYAKIVPIKEGELADFLKAFVENKFKF